MTLRGRRGRQVQRGKASDASRGRSRQDGKESPPASEQVPGRSERDALTTRLLHLPNVVGCYVGHKHARGETTGELALVCLVSEKRPVSISGAVPTRVAFQLTSRSKGWIRTDVVQTGRLRRAKRVVCGPGDGVMGRSAGTVGMALSHPAYGPVVTSAGHVFTTSGWTGEREFGLGERPEVTFRNVPTGDTFTGELLKVVVNSQADYALVRPRLDFPAFNAYHDSLPLGVPYQPSADEVEAPLRVLAVGGERPTNFSGLHGSVRLGDEGLIEDVILTRRCTAGGDSGGALVDRYRRVWGLLVGFGGDCSVFMSPYVPIQRERAQYR